jgi:dTDP-4-dehydrorhamnose reductase
MKKILVLGANGMLGVSLVKKISECNYFIETHSRNDATTHNFDLSNCNLVYGELNKILPDVIINLIANTDVDFCEDYPEQAYADNVLSIEHVVSWIKLFKRDIRFIHISTDQVYDGKGPHKEVDTKLPNSYAASKFSAETLVSSIANNLILRTNFFGKSIHQERISFSDWIVNSIKENKKITIFENISFSPLSINTLVDIIIYTIGMDKTGVYNLGSNSGMSKARFAQELAKTIKLSNKNLIVGSDADFNFSAFRPKDMRMCCKKFESDFNIKLPNLIDEINLVGKNYE